jgi:hypothetical protein
MQTHLCVSFLRSRLHNGMLISLGDCNAVSSDFSFPEDARWNAERKAVEFGVEIGEYHGLIRVPRRALGAAGADDPAGAARRAAALDRDAGCDERHPVPAARRLPWRYLPRDSSPPRSTVYNIFRKFQREGVWEVIWAELHMTLRERMGREASPSAAVLDSQSVKSAEKGTVKTTK